MNADELGKINYDAYCDTRDWKSFNGDPLPQWPAVLPDIKTGWIAAASAVATRVRMTDAEAAAQGMAAAAGVEGKAVATEVTEFGTSGTITPSGIQPT